jgi:serine/threonine protein kinase
MSSLTQPVSKQSRHNGNTRSAKEWLDALSSGACDQEAFFSGVGDLLHRAPDAGWDLLALVDQYYRRGKISAELFSSVNMHLHGLVMGKGRSEEVSVPLPGLLGDTPPAPPPSPAEASPAAVAPAEAPPAAVVPAEASPAAVAPAEAPPAAVAPAPSPAPPDAGAPSPARVAARAGHAARHNDSSNRAAPAPHAASTPVAATRDAADTARKRTQRSLAAGDVLRDRYRVQGVLGQGGMGTVFAALDLYRLDRSHGEQQVAIKVLHTEVIKRPRLFAELRREFQHLQTLSHPNIVRVHEFDRDGDLAFFTMEYLSGALLSRVLFAQESSALYRPYALAIVRDVGAAVAHAHARGVVHGDLNPGNIFVTDNGEIRVLDFGASHQLHRGPWISEFEHSRQIAVATPKYASCQLLEGEAADARDDVYALACITYVLLTGNHPFQDNTALKARTLRLVAARPRGLSRLQWNALKAGLHFDREQRPTDMQAWLDRLDLGAAATRLPELPSLFSLRPRRRRTGTKWPMTAAVAALIVACAWWATTNVDSITRAAASLDAQFKSRFAHTMVSQLWDKDHGATGIAAPVVETRAADLVAPVRPAPAAAPASAPPPVHASEMPIRSAAPSKPMIVTRNSQALPSDSQAAPAGSSAPGAHLNAGAAPVGAVSNSTVGAAQPASATGQNGSPTRARIELAADSVDVAPTDTVARVLVHRTRALRGDVSFNWWTESGTAKPGRDFSPVKSHVEHIENGKNAADLMIPIVRDPGQRASRSFYVVIDDASDNAALGPRTLTMITIPGSD